MLVVKRLARKERPSVDRRRARRRRRLRVRQRHGLSRLLARAARNLRGGGGAQVTTLALIVGSGFQQLGFEVLTRSPTKTPYGEPSSAVLTLAIRGARAVHRAARRGSRARAARDQLSSESLGARAARRARVHRDQYRRLDRRVVIARRARRAGPAHRLHARAGFELRRGRRAGAAHRLRRAVLAGAPRPDRRCGAAECGFAVRGGTYGVTQGPRLETAAEIGRLARDGVRWSA